MTPFGIRKKIKALLGMEKKEVVSPPPRPKYKVNFLLANGNTYDVDAKEGDSLVLASGRGPYPIATGCADGTCATCQVEILEGHEVISAEDGHEQSTKQQQGVDSNLRLGCQVAVLGEGVKVKIINVLGEELVD